MDRPFVWEGTFRLEVAPVWVADGFDLTPDRLRDLLADAVASELGWARPDEVSFTGTITVAPDSQAIRKEQGE